MLAYWISLIKSNLFQSMDSTLITICFIKFSLKTCFSAGILSKQYWILYKSLVPILSKPYWIQPLSGYLFAYWIRLNTSFKRVSFSSKGLIKFSLYKRMLFYPEKSLIKSNTNLYQSVGYTLIKQKFYKSLVSILCLPY